MSLSSGCWAKPCGNPQAGLLTGRVDWRRCCCSWGKVWEQKSTPTSRTVICTQCREAYTCSGSLVVLGDYHGGLLQTGSPVMSTSFSHMDYSVLCFHLQIVVDAIGFTIIAMNFWKIYILRIYCRVGKLEVRMRIETEEHSLSYTHIHMHTYTHTLWVTQIMPHN